VRPAGRWGHPPKPAKEVSTDSEPPASPPPTPLWPPHPQRAPATSACEPYRELIALAVARGRQAMAIWRDLVDDHGFASVRRFVRQVLATPGPHTVNQEVAGSSPARGVTKVHLQAPAPCGRPQ
jgi:hypothetical protein